MSAAERSGRFDPVRFLRRLGAVPEPAMRVALWRECFEEAEPGALVAVVEAALAAASDRGADGAVGFLALAQCLDAIPALRGRLLVAATLAGSAPVLALLADDPPMQVAEFDTLRPPPLGEDREITLGERRSWARRPDRDLIDRLLLDPDPLVIDNLLQNPRVVEADVLRVASRRPASAEVLSLVFRHPRWGRRPAVQAALLQNPFTPVEIAVGLVELVDLTVARRIAREPSIHPVVRGRARARSKPRAGEG